MAINIQTPLLLWLLLGNLLFLWIPKVLKKKKSIYHVGLRMLVFSLIIVGLSGIELATDARAIHTVILVDRSDSMISSNEQVKTYIDSQLEKTTPLDYVEIIAFGEDVGIEQLMSQTLSSYEERVIIDKRGTNLENAVNFAINRFDHEKNKRLLLISDFEETSGDLLEALLNEQEMVIEYKHFIPERIKLVDSQLAIVEMPKRVSVHEKFPVAVSVYSNSDTPATLTIFSNDEIIVQKNISLEKGMQRFVFEDAIETTGKFQYVARIEAMNDTISANNQWNSIIEVEGPPQLLVIDPNNEGENFELILSKQGIVTTRLVQNVVDYDLEKISSYDGVVLINTSIEKLSNDFLKALELYVKELGGGILTIGGSESFAVGGYEETILEELLPLNMALKVEGERYDLAMMTVIDKSGSMSSGDDGPSKMQMAKEAIIRVAKTLSPKDQLGLIAFDGQPYEVFPLIEVSNIDQIATLVAGVKADGGTSILPALQKGLESLNKSNLKGKHLLLVSDGQGEQSGFEALIAQYENITISTIAIGSDSDIQTMKRIAESGKGRFYEVKDYKKIPEIFTKETRLAMDEFIKEGLFVPERNSKHKIVEDIIQLPIIYGYVGTTAKPQSQLILSVDDEPLLSIWQYGLGKSMAWTSDVSTWTRAYYESEKGIQLLTDLPAAIFSTQEFKSVQIDTSVHNNTLFVSGYQENDRQLSVDILSPTGESNSVELTQFSDGNFDGTVHVPDEGFIFLRVKDRVTDSLLLQTPVSINYSKEYDRVNKRSIIKDYKALVGSEEVMEGTLLFTDIINQTRSKKSIDTLLIVIALLLFIIDVGSRKLRFDPIQRIMNNKKRLKDESTKSSQKIDGKIIEQSYAVKSTEGKQSVKEETSDKVIDTGRLLSKKRKRE